MHKILSTKKLEASLVREAQTRGIEIIEKEFIDVRPILHNSKRSEFSTVLDTAIPYAAFTSANAVWAVAELLQGRSAGWKLCSLEGKTRSELEEHTSFGKLMLTAPDSGTLSQKIVESGIRQLVFFCGNRRRDELPLALSAAGVELTEVIVYETVQLPVAVDTDLDAVLFFSPSAVQSFFLVNELKKQTVCFAIGDTTAASIASFTNNQIVRSPSASQESMLEALMAHLAV